MKSTWLLALSIACLLGRARGGARARDRRLAGERCRVRGAALGGAGAFSLFLLLWLPGGPLGSEWARRSGTPQLAARATPTTPPPPAGGRDERARDRHR